MDKGISISHRAGYETCVNFELTYRFATHADLDLLADWNQQLISDEGHRNSMSLPQLRERMAGWLAGEYRAVIFQCDIAPVAYAVYKESDLEIYLRHFFVRRDKRRESIGSAAMALLIQKIWPHKRLVVEVLHRNQAAFEFWQHIGYEPYSVCLEIPAQD